MSSGVIRLRGPLGSTEVTWISVVRNKSSTALSATEVQNTSMKSKKDGDEGTGKGLDLTLRIEVRSSETLVDPAISPLKPYMTKIHSSFTPRPTRSKKRHLFPSIIEFINHSPDSLTRK